MLRSTTLAALVPRPVLQVGLVMTLALLGDALLYVALPAHAAELGLPLWSVGILLGANRIVRLVTNGLAASAFRRVGGRAPMIAASIWAAITTAMYGLTPAFVPFLVARLIWGSCFSVLRLGAFTVVLAASEPATRGRLVGVYQSVSRMGPVLSLLIGGLLVETIGYHATFGLLGLATLPAVLLAVMLPATAYQPRGQDGHGGRDDQGRRDDEAGGDDEPGRDDQAGHGDQAGASMPRRVAATGRWGWRERWLGGRRLVAVKVGMLSNGFASQGVILATLTLALAEVAGTAEGAAALGGLLVAFRWGADLFLAPALGHLSDRIGRGRMIPALLIGEAVAVAGFALAGDRAALATATVVVFLASTALTAASDAAAGDLAPTGRRAEVMSGYSDWIDVGAALGPPLAFVLADVLGLRASYTLTAVLLAAAGGWFVLAWRLPTAGPPAPAGTDA